MRGRPRIRLRRVRTSPCGPVSRWWMRFHRANPDVPYNVIKDRFGVGLRSVKRWLADARKAENSAPARADKPVRPREPVVDEVDGAGVHLDNLVDDEHI